MTARTVAVAVSSDAFLKLTLNTFVPRTRVTVNDRNKIATGSATGGSDAELGVADAVGALGVGAEAVWPDRCGLASAATTRLATAGLRMISAWVARNSSAL